MPSGVIPNNIFDGLDARQFWKLIISYRRRYVNTTWMKVIQGKIFRRKARHLQLISMPFSLVEAVDRIRLKYLRLFSVLFADKL